MKRPINVIRAIGRGSSELSAYDDALFEAGIGNCNIIALSSVIPPGWEPDEQRTVARTASWGDRLYVVQAMSSSGGAGSDAAGLAAGIGWVMFDHTGGLMVEHHAVSATPELAAAEVDRQIGLSIDDMCSRRQAAPSKTGKTIASAQARGPTCVLVVALFQAEGW
ncbi:pyruvoyl-dependent arginine decarboxylase [Trinickia sp.]|uniref:pyruvoyl-dependent arginine decarboxylase n=1 Tax=Trinickia sp. TaxID=2571163 RepID=UPI003F7CFF63